VPESGGTRDPQLIVHRRELIPGSRAASIGLSEDAYLCVDPRASDLSTDSHLWTALLRRTYEIDGAASDGLFGALLGLRSLGARLEESLVGVHLRRGELTKTEYADLRARYLLSRASLLERLLIELADVGAADLLSA